MERNESGARERLFVEDERVFVYSLEYTKSLSE